MNTFVGAVVRHDTSAARQSLWSGATMTYGDDSAVDVAQLGERLDGAHPTKMVGAGPTVAVSLRSEHRRGVLFARLARRGDVITGIRYFPG